MSFNEDYYRANAQDADRSALGFYARLWRHYCGQGPVLEFGCGVGHLARRLSAHATVYALETNPYALQQISVNAPRARVLASLDDLPDGSLGSMVSLHVLEHIPAAEIDTLGARLACKLRGGGRALIVVPDLEGAAHAIKGARWLGFSDRTHVNLSGASTWSERFTRWGLNLVRVGADGYYDFPYGAGFRERAKDAGRLFRTGIQFIAGRLILKVGDGEACIFLLERKL